MSHHRTGLSVAATIDLVTPRDPQAKMLMESAAFASLHAVLATIGADRDLDADTFDGWHERALAEIAAEGRIGGD